MKRSFRRNNRKQSFLVLVLGCLLLGSLLLTGCGSRGLVIVRDGRSDYTIVLPESSAKMEEQAAEMIQSHIQKMTGCLIPIEAGGDPSGEHLIFLSPATRGDDMSAIVPGGDLEEDGFSIRTDGSRLFIAGGREKGLLYGVHTLLEDYWGCRRWSAEEMDIPLKKTLRLPFIDRTEAPFFRHREIHMPDTFDSGYADWHKLDNRDVRSSEWGMWVHTFDDLVPPDRYFKEHPEYYSEINGVRVPDAQLCLANPDVFMRVVEGLRERMADRPEAKYWSVSQNDTYYPCQCEECRKLEEQYGGPSGAILHFVNRVAREFPDKIISTLAYQYSRPAPVGIRPEKNVNIMLCTIELNRSRPIAEDPLSADFRKDIEDWGRLTDNIILWDYVVQFRNLIDPFPNLRVLKPNIRFFAANNVRLMFQQGSGGLRSEFHRLRTYLIAKLLWDPEADVDALMDDFLSGYYGPAAPFIQRYIRIMHDALEETNGDLGIYGYPWDGAETYLRPELIREYGNLFDRAAAAVEGHPDFARRVEFARLPLEFAVLELSKRNPTPELSLFVREEKTWKVNPLMDKRLRVFVEGLDRHNVSRLDEHGVSPQEYRASIEAFFEYGRVEHAAVGKPVRLLTKDSPKYPVGGPGALTDGLRGTTDFHCSWLGFEGAPMNAVVDLEEVREMHSLSAGFIQDQVSWIWIPDSVTFFISTDGDSYKEVGRVIRRSEKRWSNVFTETFSCSFPPRRARYILVTTANNVFCPLWHKGAGGLAWIFSDEIIVH